MASDKIEYQDKELFKKSGLPNEKTFRYQDANEIKRVVNSHADELDNMVVGGDMTKAVYDPQDKNSDAFDRSNHTGEQAISTVTELQDELDEKLKQGDNTLTEDLVFQLSDFIYLDITNYDETPSNFNYSSRFRLSSDDVLIYIQGGDGAGSSTNTSYIRVNYNDGIVIKEEITGKGVKLNNRSVDEANVDFETDDNNLLSIGKAKENLTKKALTQTEVNTTPKVISSTDSDTTFNVYGVGALCVFTINTGSLNVGEAFEINIGDSDGVDVVGVGVNIFGAITGSTTVGDSVLVRRIQDDSFGLTGEVYKVY